MTVWYLLCCLGKKGRNINTTGRTETTRTCLPPSLPHQENTLRSIIHPQYLHFSSFFSPIHHTFTIIHPLHLPFLVFLPIHQIFPPITQLLPSSESTLFFPHIHFTTTSTELPFLHLWPCVLSLTPHSLSIPSPGITQVHTA